MLVEEIVAPEPGRVDRQVDHADSGDCEHTSCEEADDEPTPRALRPAAANGDKFL